MHSCVAGQPAGGAAGVPANGSECVCARLEQRHVRGLSQHLAGLAWLLWLTTADGKTDTVLSPTTSSETWRSRSSPRATSRLRISALAARVDGLPTLLQFCRPINHFPQSSAVSLGGRVRAKRRARLRISENHVRDTYVGEEDAGVGTKAAGRVLGLIWFRASAAVPRGSTADQDAGELASLGHL